MSTPHLPFKVWKKSPYDDEWQCDAAFAIKDDAEHYLAWLAQRLIPEMLYRIEVPSWYEERADEQD